MANAYIAFLKWVGSLFDLIVMKIDKERLDTLGTLARSVTHGVWAYSDGVVKTSDCPRLLESRSGQTAA